jgi:hypothetical protein
VRPSLCLSVALLALTSVSPALSQDVAPSPYPAIAVLDAVKAACSRLEARADTVADLETNGWVPVTLPADSPLGQLLAMGKAAGEKMLKADGGSIVEPEAFAKTVAGEELTIILSGVSTDEAKVNGCRIYDVGETRPLDPAIVTKWMAREPTRTNSNDALTLTNWSPGLATGHDSFDVYFVPAKSPLVALLKVSGVAIRVDQIVAAK